ncbi:MAG TPA: hypothetical protein VFS83_14900 [Ktedonobacterales bacterium]|nr:hypothetical protein [Ktedonobacterales bacterium]
MAPLSGWENFYVIVGSSAGALTGLMFVVITLVAGNAARQSGGGELAAYGTPNVVHFCAVLFLSAMLAAPWESLHVVGVLLVVAGIAGAVYATIIAWRVIRRAGLADSYDPVFEDWLWFVTLPLVAYGALVVAAFLFLVDPTPALFVIGAAMILLLSIGIHNAWDTVTYIATERLPSPTDEKDDKKD